MAAKVTSEPAAKVGDRIVVESEKVGQREREGTILATSKSAAGTSYEVRWDDGHESGIRPAAGSARIVHAGTGRHA